MAGSVISRDDALAFAMSKESTSVEKIPAAAPAKTTMISGVGNAADHYTVSDREITSTFNASVGMNGYRPAVAASYSRFDTDAKGNSLSLAAGAKARWAKVLRPVLLPLNAGPIRWMMAAVSMSAQARGWSFQPSMV